MSSEALRQGARPSIRQRLLWRLQEARRNRLLRNILTLAGGTAGAQAMTLAFIPLITRLYGPEAYGVLGVFMGLVMMLVPLAALTYPIAIVLPERDADARGLAKLSLGIAAAIAAALALLLLGCGDALASGLGVEEAAPYLLMLPLAMFSAAALEVAQQWLIRNQRFGLSARVAVLHSLLHNGSRLVGGLLHAVPAVLVVTTALGPTLHALMLAIGIRRDAAKNGPQAAPTTPATAFALARQHRDFPLFRAPMMLINSLSQNLPVLVLAAFFGAAPAGFFALCKQALSMPTNLLGKAVADVYYPRLTRAIQRDEPITSMLLKASGGLALVGLLPFGLVFAIGPWLFALVFGQDWALAGEYARWLALAEFSVFISRPCTVAVPALGLQGRCLVFELFSAALRIASLLGGALLLQGALATVVAFSFASVAIYLGLIALVALESWRRYVRGAAAGRP